MGSLFIPSGWGCQWLAPIAGGRIAPTVPFPARRRTLVTVGAGASADLAKPGRRAQLERSPGCRGWAPGASAFEAPGEAGRESALLRRRSAFK